MRPGDQGADRSGFAAEDEPVQGVHQGVQGQEGKGGPRPSKHAH